MSAQSTGFSYKKARTWKCSLCFSCSPIYLSFYRVTKEMMESLGFQGNLELGAKLVFQVYQEIRAHLVQRSEDSQTEHTVYTKRPIPWFTDIELNPAKFLCKEDNCAWYCRQKNIRKILTAFKNFLIFSTRYTLDQQLINTILFKTVYLINPSIHLRCIQNICLPAQVRS